ncbi:MULTISPECIES: hypothetical protein [unclassified Leptolyngbya]|uniref:hypothetical protein n=1 Tax=unclassified Leptolyngbya TaxID=2650499 RepID=UPI00168403CC|nr:MULTISPECIES: hypothetical protein [unclassified Leptolyngbya]MBD1910880.1 hypothetical protein [Leptolyngbya sp. FACHB-8]
MPEPQAGRQLLETANHQEAIAQKDEEIAHLHQQLEALHQAQADLATVTTEREQQIFALRQKNEELGQQLQKASQATVIAEKDQQIAALQQETEELWQQLAAGASAEKAIAEKDRQIADLRRHIEELRLQLQARTEEGSTLPSKNRQIAELQQQLQDLRLQLQNRPDPQRQLAQKDRQIAELQQKLADQTSNFIRENKPEGHRKDSHPPTVAPPSSTLDPVDVERQLKDHLGTTVWFCLDDRSQHDLSQAILLHQQQILLQETDFSEVGDRLCDVIAREIIQPFFQALYDFLTQHNRPPDIGGISLEANKQYTFGLLPSLIAPQWETLNVSALQGPEFPPDNQLYMTGVPAQLVGGGDRNLMQQFLHDWEHPLATWLLEEAEEAASWIDQTHKLHARIGQDAPLYEWQYDLLACLVMGDEDWLGILQAVYRGHG